MTSMAWMAQGQRLEVEVPPADAGSARKHLQSKRYCTTAVCPRGAQVRSRCGASLNPLLSIKTTVRFSESLFLMCGQLAFFRSAEPCANVIGCNYEHFSPQCGSFTRLHTILFGSTKLGLFASSRLARLLCWKALLRGEATSYEHRTPGRGRTGQPLHTDGHEGVANRVGVVFCYLNQLSKPN
jgi:hypothetical protein